MFFQLVSTIKEQLVDAVMQSTCLCVILHAKHEKLRILSLYN